jgi:hypothetical protein
MVKASRAYTHLLVDFWPSAGNRRQLLLLGLARRGASSHHLEMVLTVLVDIVRVVSRSHRLMHLDGAKLGGGAVVEKESSGRSSSLMIASP